MKHLPNILSLLRMVGAVALLLSDVSGVLFGVLYIVCRVAGPETEVRYQDWSIAG